MSNVDLYRGAVREWIEHINQADEQTLLYEVRDELVWTLDHLLERIEALEAAQGKESRDGV